MAFKKYTGDRMKSPMKQGVRLSERVDLANFWQIPEAGEYIWSGGKKPYKEELRDSINKRLNREFKGEQLDSARYAELRDNPMFRRSYEALTDMWKEYPSSAERINPKYKKKK